MNYKFIIRGGKMETFKKIMLWVAIIVIVFFVTNFCNFYIIASTYKDIDCKITNSNNLEIAKKECKATYVNGYCKLSVKNTSETDISNKYIILEGYSEYNNNLTNKYIKIDNIKAGEEKEIQFNYKAQEVKNVSVYVTENEPEKEKFDLNEEVDGPSILIGAILLLYFFG
jgi:hypothetical protein